MTIIAALVSGGMYVGALDQRLLSLEKEVAENKDLIDPVRLELQRVATEMRAMNREMVRAVTTIEAIRDRKPLPAPPDEAD